MKTPSKRAIIARIALVVACVELLIMLSFASFKFDLGIYSEVILDVFILATLSTPLIYFWVIRPYVSARDEAMDRVTHMASHDSLTQLANRYLLSEFLEKVISRFVRENSYGALLFIDLDGFKSINDEHCHDAGDATLVEVAKRLRANVRNEDIVSRVGGDEFAVVLSQLGTNKELATTGAIELAERILNALKEEIDFRTIKLKIGASIGLRLLAPERITSEFVLKDADSAMYKAKRDGKGIVVVHLK